MAQTDPERFEETGRRAGGELVGRIAAICGALGLVVGLVRGLTVYAPTAWAAAFEVGIPAAVAGALLGLGVVGVRGFLRRHRVRSARR